MKQRLEINIIENKVHNPFVWRNGLFLKFHNLNLGLLMLVVTSTKYDKLVYIKYYNTFQQKEPLKIKFWTQISNQ